MDKTWEIYESENVSFWKRLTSSVFHKQILINFFICLISTKQVLVFEDTAFIRITRDFNYLTIYSD